MFYFRKHKNKEYSFPIEFINYLIKNYSVNIVGDKINLNNIKNYGYLNHGQVVNYYREQVYNCIEKIFLKLH